MLDCRMPATVSASLTLNSKRFYLDASLPEASHLASLLVVCLHSETLSVEWGNGCVGFARLHWGKMNDVLREHGRQLKHLTLNTVNCSIEHGGNDRRTHGKHEGYDMPT